MINYSWGGEVQVSEVPISEVPEESWQFRNVEVWNGYL